MSIRAAQDVGVLFFRGDGGDPAGLRPDDDRTVMYVAPRHGEGRFYQNGREAQINPAVQESVRQIARSQFERGGAAAIPVQLLPAPARRLFGQFGSGAPLRVVFSHPVTRADTAPVSETLAARFLAMESRARDADRNGTVELVRMVMRMYGLKSDVCDHSSDPRCDRPGVREAFAQIKREEMALAGLSSPRS